MMDEAFLKAFAEVVRQQIAHQCEVQVDGAGVFRPEHKNQYQQQYQDGRVVMMPPEDRIQFVAEKKHSDAH